MAPIIGGSALGLEAALLLDLWTLGGEWHHQDLKEVKLRVTSWRVRTAMARRLQEEMYSENPASGDGVRAPIGRTTETLVGPDASWGLEDDREAAVLEQLRRRAQPRGEITPAACGWMIVLLT